MAHFALKHETQRKEMECTFRVLNCKWHIIVRPSVWELDTMNNFTNTCIIRHNMYGHDLRGHCERDFITDLSSLVNNIPYDLVVCVAQMTRLQNKYINEVFTRDLGAHFWMLKGLVNERESQEVHGFGQMNECEGEHIYHVCMIFLIYINVVLLEYLYIIFYQGNVY